MSTPEPCTTQAASKQHWSANLTVVDKQLPARGRRGKTLCGLIGAVDQDRATYLRGIAIMRGTRPIGLLPVCRPCEKAVAKLETLPRARP